MHGALCVAYSGQCLTSEALGGRSANRGECAQACRMPYEIVCDGQLVDLGKTQYLLSPQDLAAYDLIPRLIELGVASLKIEGRLKTPEYVANITRHYRQAIDAAWAGRPVAFTPRDVEEMQLSFSRGFSHGFLDGNNHKVLVRGDYAKKRGIFLGRVESITSCGRAWSPCSTDVKPGDGVVFDGDDRPRACPSRGAESTRSLVGSRPGRVELRFGRDCDRPAPGSSPVRESGRPTIPSSPPAAPIVRRTPGPAGRSGSGRPCRGRRAARSVARDLGERASCPVGPSLRCAPAQIAARRSERCSATSSAGWAARSIGSAVWHATIEGEPDGSQEPAQPVPPRAGGSARTCGRGPRARALAAEPVLPGLLAPIQPGTAATASSKSSVRQLAVDRVSRVLCRRTDQIEAAVALGIPRSTPITRTSSSTPRPSPRPGAEARRSTWPHRGSRSPARRTCSATWPSREPTAFSSATPAGCTFAPSDRSRSSPTSRSTRPIPLTVELLQESRGRAGHGLVRPQRRPALRPDRRRAARLARGGDPPADSHVSHGALRLLCLPFAGNRPDQLRPALRPSRRQAARPRRRRAPSEGRRRLPEHAVQRRSPDGGRVPASPGRPRSPALADRVPRRLRSERGADHRPLPGGSSGQREAKTLWRELKASNQYGVTRGPLNVL